VRRKLQKTTKKSTEKTARETLEKTVKKTTEETSKKRRKGRGGETGVVGGRKQSEERRVCFGAVFSTVALTGFLICW
jgi:hypothetical protein